jgi:hypothetical protein
LEQTGESAKGRQGPVDGAAIGDGQLVKGLADALLVDLLPLGQLHPALLGEGYDRGAPIGGICVSLDQAGAHHLGDQTADRAVGEMKALGQVADPNRTDVGQILEQLDLGHR